MIEDLKDALGYYKTLVINEEALRASQPDSPTHRVAEAARFAAFQTLNLLGFGDAALEARREVAEDE